MIQITDSVEANGPRGVAGSSGSCVKQPLAAAALPPSSETPSEEERQQPPVVRKSSAAQKAS